jgi:paraquat-inducible protein B
VEVFVDAPHDRHVTGNTRFWNASGVDLTVNAQGIRLDTQSVASVLMGGIAFQTPVGVPEGPAAEAGAEFLLYPAQEAALRNPGATSDRYRLAFDQPVRGLDAGAPVELLGLDVGEVTTVALSFDEASARVRTVVDIVVHPGRLPFAASHATLDRLVQRGLRAQLRTENVLTNQRAISFALVPGARRARIDWGRTPVELPTLAGGGDDLPAAVTRLVEKLEKLPLDELAREGTQTTRELRRTLEGTSRLVSRVEGELPQLGLLMSQATRTLGSVEQTMSSESPLQQELRGALRDLGGAGYALRALAESLERHPESLIRGNKEDRP